MENTSRRIVTKKMEATHLVVLRRSRLAASGSDFAKEISPFCLYAHRITYLHTVNKKRQDGNRRDKSYGLGRVVFHRMEPAVAVQAVSI